MDSSLHEHGAKETKLMPINPCSLTSCYYALGRAEVRLLFGPS